MENNQQSKKRIWLNLFRVVAGICVFVAFYFWSPWISALSANEASQKYPGKIDPTWRAVIVEHGSIKEWKLGTPSQNPIGFSLCTAILFSSIIYLVGSAYYIEKRK